MARQERPNIVLIMYDQMRYDCAGFAGSAQVLTPAMDRFAREGVCFENAYCASPLCSPARASWLSGLYPHAHMQLANYGHRLKGIPGRCLPERVVTISDVLAKAGYRCGLAGPWHLGYDEKPQHGYDAMWAPYKYPYPQEADAYKQHLKRHGLIETYARGKKGPLGRSADKINARECFADVAATPTAHQRTTWLVDRAIHFIDTQAGPLFFFASIKDPHPPILPPQECYDLYDPATCALPRNRQDLLEGKPAFLRKCSHYGAGDFAPETMREVMAHYYALITHVDQQVGRFMEALRSKGIDENTLVAIISDHGEMMGEHGFFAKSLMYEGAVRVPCLLRWPGRLARGTRIKELFAGVDLMPTLLDLAGVPLISPVHGRSMAEAARSGTEPDAPNTVFAEIGDMDEKNDPSTPVENLAATMMVREGVWKHIVHRFDPCQELYNLADDSGEMVNRIDDPAARGQLDRLRRRIHERLNADGPGPYAWALEMTSDPRSV